MCVRNSGAAYTDLPSCRSCASRVKKRERKKKKSSLSWALSRIAGSLWGSVWLVMCVSGANVFRNATGSFSDQRGKGRSEVSFVPELSASVGVESILCGGSVRYTGVASWHAAHTLSYPPFLLLPHQPA